MFVLKTTVRDRRFPCSLLLRRASRKTEDDDFPAVVMLQFVKAKAGSGEARWQRRIGASSSRGGVGGELGPQGPECNFLLFVACLYCWSYK